MTTFIHHDGALGDVLLSLPSIRAIRAEYGPVHLAGRPDIMRVLKEAGEADEISSSDGRVYASLHADTQAAGAKTFFDAFDRAFVFTVRDDSPLFTAMRGTVPNTTPVLTVAPEGAGTHVAEYRLNQLGGRSEERHEPLNVPPFYREEVRMLLARAGYAGGKPLIAVHPGSGGKRKCWPLEHYLGLIDELQRERNAFVLLLAGPAEEQSMRNRIEAFCREREKAVFVSDKELMIVGAVLRECDLCIGNDSGVSHLAAAVGCPVVALFGPTDPALWRPRGRTVRVVPARNGGGMSSITTQEVLEAIHEMQDRSARPFA